MLFSNDKKKDGTPKKRSTLGFLFNPGIETEIAPLRENFGMFARMIALIFVMNGLFPKDHPALENQKLRLSLREVITTAWRNVSFTKEKTPQAVVFVAVTGILAISALFLISVIFSLFIGNAHAQGVFETTSTSDWGISLIDYLFYGKPISQVGGTQDCSMQTALSTALGFFSSAVLVLAGFLLLYHLVSMIAKTAHSGKPFEGANQVWAPIRLVFAIALLIPLPSGATGGNCSVTGYNSGQYLVVKIAKWGSGLGSNAWAHFMNSLDNYSAGITCAKSSDKPSCVNATQNVTALVSSLIVYDACSKYANHYLNQLHGPGSTGYVVTDIVSASAKEGDHYFGYKVNTSLTEKWFELISPAQGVDPLTFCGGYNIPDKPSKYTWMASPAKNSNFIGIYDAAIDVFNSNLKPAISSFNSTYYKQGIDGVNAEINPVSMLKDYKNVVENYQTELSAAIKSAIDSSKANAEQTVKEEFTQVKDYGWVYAGAWFNTIARLQSEKFAVLQNSQPTPIAPKMLSQVKGEDDKVKLTGIQESTKAATEKYAKAIEIMGDYIDSQYVEQKDIWAKVSEISEVAITVILHSLNPITAVSDALIGMGAVTGLWDANGTLGIKYGMTENPFEEITSFGQKNIAVGTIAIGMAATVGLLGTTVSILGNAVSLAVIATYVASFITFIASIFFTIGFTMAYIVVLYPFYRFFFGTIQWLFTVFEAIILVPLFALAHINPGGDGLPGPKAAYGYSIAMQLLLRPVLMIFGLVAGFLIFKVSLALLNEMFTVVAMGTGNLAGLGSLFAKIVYTVIYAVIVVMLANHCFRTIGVFPQVALQWLGAGRIHEERVGDPGMLTGAAAYMSNTLLQKAVPSISGAPSGALKSINEKQQASIKDKTDKNLQAARIAKEGLTEIDVLDKNGKPTGAKDYI